MGMFGDRDNIVSPRQWQALQQGLPGVADRAVSRRPGILSCWMSRKIFMEKLKDFLDTCYELHE